MRSASANALTTTGRCLSLMPHLPLNPIQFSYWTSPTMIAALQFSRGLQGGAGGQRPQYSDLTGARTEGVLLDVEVPEANQQPRLCNVPGCGRPHYAKDYCQAHYRRVWRYGSAFTDIEVGNQTSGQRPICRDCSEPDCDRPHVARGLCGTHYQQLTRTRRVRP